ncbi:MAG: hypothetical protein ACPHI0_05750, partial [Paracoccaceae bacterium]
MSSLSLIDIADIERTYGEFARVLRQVGRPLQRYMQPARKMGFALWNFTNPMAIRLGKNPSDTNTRHFCCFRFGRNPDLGGV